MKTNGCFFIALCGWMLLMAACCPAARVELVQAANQIEVRVEGKLFTSYLWQVDPNHPLADPKIKMTKPVLYPVYSPAGRMMVRGYPLAAIKGESRDHPHHMGIYFTVDIGQEHFWGNSAAELPRIEHLKVVRMESGDPAGTLATQSRWLDHQGQPLLTESRVMTFRAADKNQYEIDLDITLTPLDKTVTIGDTKEGMLAMRVAPWLTEQDGSGCYLNSEGQQKEAGVWGRRARWMQLAAGRDDTAGGVIMFNHPQSINYPTFWHARGYGCFAANPLGQGVFEQAHNVANARPLNLTLKSGQAARFKYRLIIYEGIRTKESIETEFDAYISTKTGQSEKH